MWSRASPKNAILRERVRLGQRLRGLRESKGLTQEQAAEAIGIHAKHVGRIESGDGNPTVSTLISLAMAYDVRFPVLFDDSDAEPRRAKC